MKTIGIVDKDMIEIYFKWEELYKKIKKVLIKAGLELIYKVLQLWYVLQKSDLPYQFYPAFFQHRCFPQGHQYLLFPHSRQGGALHFQP